MTTVKFTVNVFNLLTLVRHSGRSSPQHPSGTLGQQAWWRLTVDEEGVEVTEAVAKRVEMTGALDRADTTVTVEEDKAAGTGLHRSH